MEEIANIYVYWNYIIPIILFIIIALWFGALALKDLWILRTNKRNHKKICKNAIFESKTKMSVLTDTFTTDWKCTECGKSIMQYTIDKNP